MAFVTVLLKRLCIADDVIWLDGLLFVIVIVPAAAEKTIK